VGHIRAVLTSQALAPMMGEEKVEREHSRKRKACQDRWSPPDHRRSSLRGPFPKARSWTGRFKEVLKAPEIFDFRFPVIILSDNPCLNAATNAMEYCNGFVSACRFNQGLTKPSRKEVNALLKMKGVEKKVSYAASCHAPSCHAPSCHAPACHAPSCHAPSCHAPACHAPACHAPA